MFLLQLCRFFASAFNSLFFSFSLHHFMVNEVVYNNNLWPSEMNNIWQVIIFLSFLLCSRRTLSSCRLPQFKTDLKRARIAVGFGRLYTHTGYGLLLQCTVLRWWMRETADRQSLEECMTSWWYYVTLCTDTLGGSLAGRRQVFRRNRNRNRTSADENTQNSETSVQTATVKPFSQHQTLLEFEWTAQRLSSNMHIKSSRATLRLLTPSVPSTTVLLPK